MRRPPYSLLIVGGLLVLSALLAWGTRQSTSFEEVATQRQRSLSGTPQQRTAMETLYRQALAHGERQVVVYQAAMDYEWQPLWAAFAQAFPGLRVTYMHLSPTGVTDRLDIERATAAHYGDVISQPVNVVLDIARRGYLQAYSPATADALDARFRPAGDQVIFGFQKVYGLGYDQRRASAERLPGDLAELLAGDWRGAYEYGAPGGGAGTTDVALVQLLERQRIDDEQLQALRDGGGAGGAQEAGVIALAQGRTALNPWAYLPPLIRQQRLGVPIGIAFPQDFTLLVPFGQGLVRDAAHPHAARLLLTWLLSPDAQALLASQSFSLGTTTGAPLPPGLSEEAAARALEASLPPEVLAARLKERVPVFRAIWQKSG